MSFRIPNQVGDKLEKPAPYLIRGRNDRLENIFKSPVRKQKFLFRTVPSISVPAGKPQCKRRNLYIADQLPQFYLFLILAHLHHTYPHNCSKAHILLILFLLTIFLTSFLKQQIPISKSQTSSKFQ